MSGVLNYFWRLFATALCFVLFGLGGLLFTVFVLPLLYVLPKRQRVRHARQLIHLLFRLFVGLMQLLRLVRLEVTGASELRHCRCTLVLANHPTLIDVVVLISLMPHASCVVKQALWHNFFVGAVVRAAGYISNSDPAQLLADCSKDLAMGNPLIIFPEGTRTQADRVLHFLRGASYISLTSKVPILPVLIECIPSALTKGECWYRIPPRRVLLRVAVLEPIRSDCWVNDESPCLAARKLTIALESFFTQELKRWMLPSP